MKRLAFLLLVLLSVTLHGSGAGLVTQSGPRLFVEAPAVAQGLQFPTNADSPAGQAVAFKFSDPQRHGLPMWGPGNAGITVIREYTPLSQAGYYAVIWWGNDGTFDSTAYWGFHPYPLVRPRSTQTTHVWELAGVLLNPRDGDHIGDNVITRAGTSKTVVKGVKYVQALRITRNGNGTKTAIAYWALPSTARADVTEVTSDAGFGERNPSDPVVYVGDSPWAIGDERLSGTLWRVKIFAKVLSEADTLAEAADMSRLVTTDGQNHIWWGKNGYAGVDDLTDDYGTGRSFHWVNSNRATLVN